MNKIITERIDFSYSLMDCETLKDLKNRIEEYINEYGENVKIEIDAEEYDTYPTVMAEILIEREETDEEYSERVKKEEQKNKQILEKEKVEFERLKQIFGKD